MADLSIPILLRGYPSGQDDPRAREIDLPVWEAEEVREYVVQFTHSLLAYERREMQVSYGLELEEYVPKYTYLEWVDEETAAALEQHPLINAAFPLAVLRVEPGIMDEGEEETPFDDVEPEKRLVWVMLNPRAHPEQVARDLTERGGDNARVLDDRIIGGAARVQVEMPVARIPDIADIEGVRWVENVREPSPDSVDLGPVLETGFSPAPLGVNLALEAGLRGKDQVVGIIDFGTLDDDHCWFRDNALGHAGASHRKLVGNRDDTPDSRAVHASFVCGIVAGDDVDHPGVEPLRGIASDARLTYGNTWDVTGPGTVQTLYSYLARATLDGAYIHNTSWHLPPDVGTPEQEYSAIAYDTDRFVWAYPECLVVASSGNSGERRGPPGSAKNSLCVSAAYVDKATGNGCLADGVGGPTFDRRRKPDLLAPGCDISSAVLTTAAPADLCPKKSHKDAGIPNAGHVGCDAAHEHFCAASFAAPVAAAAAAIVRQYFVEGWYPTGEPKTWHKRVPSAALLKATLIGAAAKPDPAAANYPTNGEGWGLLRLNRILRLPSGTREMRVWDVRNSAGMFTGESRSRRVRVTTAGQPLRVTLVWSDPPGLIVAADPVVNDLDLVVTSPDGTQTYLGNWFRNGVSHPHTAADPALRDDRNNVEVVLVNNAATGFWTITVKATEVNVGNTGQGYALVVRGALD